MNTIEYNWKPINFLRPIFRHLRPNLSTFEKNFYLLTSQTPSPSKISCFTSVSQSSAMIARFLSKLDKHLGWATICCRWEGNNEKVADKWKLWWAKQSNENPCSVTSDTRQTRGAKRQKMLSEFSFELLFSRSLAKVLRSLNISNCSDALVNVNIFNTCQYEYF